MAIRSYEVIERSGEIEKLVLDAVRNISDHGLPAEERGVATLNIYPVRGDIPTGEGQRPLRFRPDEFRTRPAGKETPQTSLLAVLGVTLELPSSRVNLRLAADPNGPAELSLVEKSTR